MPGQAPDISPLPPPVRQVTRHCLPQVRTQNIVPGNRARQHALQSQKQTE